MTICNSSQLGSVHLRCNQSNIWWHSIVETVERHVTPLSCVHSFRIGHSLSVLHDCPGLDVNLPPEWCSEAEKAAKRREAESKKNQVRCFSMPSWQNLYLNNYWLLEPKCCRPAVQSTSMIAIALGWHRHMRFDVKHCSRGWFHDNCGMSPPAYGISCAFGIWSIAFHCCGCGSALDSSPSSSMCPRATSPNHSFLSHSQMDNHIRV